MKARVNDHPSKWLASALLSCLLLLVCSAALADEIQWETDFNTALKKAAAQKKPVMVDMYTDWCSWCKVLDEKTYSDPGVIEQSKNFINAKIDGDKDTNLVTKYNIRGYPTILFLDHTGKETYRIVGFRPPEDFLPIMKNLAQNKDPEEEIKKLIASKPSDWESLLRIAYYYMEKQDLDQAIEFVEKALANIPAEKQQEREDTTFSLVQLYLQKQRIDDAEKLLLKLEKQPNLKDAKQLQQSFVGLYLFKADKAKALEHLKKFRALTTDKDMLKQIDELESNIDQIIAQVKAAQPAPEETEAKPEPGPKPESEALHPETKVRQLASRTKATMRSVATGLESYFVDNNAYPACALGSDPPSAFAPFPRLKQRYSFRNYIRGSASTITTPIAYISSPYLIDPFSADEKEKRRPFSYYSMKNGWIVISVGPDRDYDINPERDYHGLKASQPEESLLLNAYDPTNGITSSGDIFRIKQ
jgi:thioredoxin-related protein